MKFSWIFNGTMEAHHLAAAYIVVWVMQGGYAGWIAWQWTRTRRDARPLVTFTSVTRDRS
jgi:hypothetical protein